ncbi:hypothetical protein [Caldicellulosiruptor acetigenus]|uniref:hypothetical protein n=1 Tax=Caldicellulosiruptor acetigenus TaxID=301953 RepID=UPI0001E99109|nr:hypothetical protein [Caldicellulosiruptor acetigenus]
MYDDIVGGYRKLGMPMSFKDVSIDEKLFLMSFFCAPNIRNRFTVLHLYEFLGLTEEVVEGF